MSYVTRRGKGWQAAYRDPSGKEKTSTFRRKVDAQQWLTQIENSKLTGTYIDPKAGRETFMEYAERWRRVQVHRHGTRRSVEQCLRLHVYPVIGDRPIGAIRACEVQALVQSMSEKLAASTVEVAYGRVVAVFRSAVKDRIIITTPCEGIKRPESNSTSAVLQVLEADQVQALVEAAPDRYRALVIAGAGLGLRPSELFGLTPDRVQFLKKTVRVDQQLVRQPDGGVGFGALKTRSSYRSVPLPQAVADALAVHLSQFPPHPTLGVMFTTGGGGPVQQHPFATVWATARRRAGVPSWATPHCLRHFYASVLIRSGASVKVLQARLGHSSAKVMLDIYGHLFADEEDRTREALDDVLGAADILRTLEEKPQVSA